MRASHVHSVRIAVVNKLDSREGMRPTEIAAADARPVTWEFAMLNGNAPLGNGEDATGYIPLTRASASCAGYDEIIFVFIFAVMPNVVDLHHHLVAVG